MNPQSGTGINSKESLTGTFPKEGKLTKSVEKVTAQVPSLGFMGIALGSMAVSAGLAMFTKRKDLANFIGLWVPSLLVIGLYNKLVKVEGSERAEHLH